MIKIAILITVFVFVVYMISAKIEWSTDMVKNILVGVGIIVCIYITILLIQPSGDNYIKWTDTTRTK